MCRVNIEVVYCTQFFPYRPMILKMKQTNLIESRTIFMAS
jgi:hypothetical protein